MPANPLVALSGNMPTGNAFLSGYQAGDATSTARATAAANAAKAEAEARYKNLSIATNMGYGVLKAAEKDPAAGEAALASFKANIGRIYGPNAPFDVSTITLQDLPSLVSAGTDIVDQWKREFDQGNFDLKAWETRQNVDQGWAKTNSGIAVDNAQIGGIANANRNRDLGTALDYRKAEAGAYGQLPEGNIMEGGRSVAIPGYVPSASKAEGVSPNGVNFDDEAKLRGEYIKATDEFVTIGNSYANVLATGKQPSAAGDLSMIFAYMKMLDPNSVVREQEFANAQNAAGVPDQIRNMYNRMLNGERLNESQRLDFINQAKSLYDNANSRFAATGDQYRGLAGSYGMDPNRIVIDRRNPQVIGADGQQPVADDAAALLKKYGIE